MKTRTALVQAWLSLILIIGLLGVQPAPAAALEAAPADTRPLAEMLQPDGSLNLGTGYHGLLDPADWRMTYDVQGAPLFVPDGPDSLPAPVGTWNPLGNGLGARVYAILVVGSDVYVGGDFQDAGGNPDADYIARWDGAAWQEVGDGLNGTVYDIEMAGATLYVGGYFTQAGADPNAAYVTRLNGDTWVPVGGGLNSYVYALEAVGERLYAGGGITQVGGDVAGSYAAYWDGAAWHSMRFWSAGGLDGPVYAIETVGGVGYMGGDFTWADIPLNYIGRWDTLEERWYPLGDGLSDKVYTLHAVGPDL